MRSAFPSENVSGINNISGAAFGNREYGDGQYTKEYSVEGYEEIAVQEWIFSDPNNHYKTVYQA